MKKVEFTKDFATKKAGDVFTCDGQLASQLVNSDKVAKFVIKKAVKKATKKA